MITLFHGDHVSASRKALIDAKVADAEAEIVELDGKSLQDSDLIQALESGSLFATKRLIIVENFFSPIGKKLKEVKRRGQLLADRSDADIIVWEPKAVGKSVVGALGKNARVNEFKTPVVIFQFLDGFVPADSSKLIDLLNSALEYDAPELIFALLVRRVRELLQIVGGVTPVGLAPWQVTKLRQQASQFSTEMLMNAHRGLTAIEYEIKTGQSATPLQSRLQRFMITLSQTR